VLTGLGGSDCAPDVPRFSRAEARALRRSAPLTHAKLQEHFKVLLATGRPGA